MNDKRDEVVEAAREFLTLHEPGDDALAMMADFALSREAEVRREMADRLEDICADYGKTMPDFIDELRGKNNG